MKAILAVNLDEALTAGLAAALHRRGLGARVQAVANPRAAEAVRQGMFDLVVVDLDEQPAPPAGLLPAIAEGSPGTRVVVLAGGAAVQAPEQPNLFDGVEILDRALPLEELSARIAAVLQRGVRGHIENVGLAAFTQLLAIEKETCVVEVRSGDRQGSVVFVRGELWDAQAGARRGDDAVIEIIGWETANVDVRGIGQQVRRTITASLTYLMFEAMRRRDELQRDASAASAAAAPPAAPPTNGSAALPAATASVVAVGGPADALVDGIARGVDGFIAVCLADMATGLMIEARSSRSSLDLELAGAFSRETLLQVQELVGALGLASSLEDLTSTFDDEIHLVKPSATGLFMYLVVDRARTSYPQMRAVVQRLWPAFEAAAAAAGLGWQPHGMTAALARGGSNL